jgi:hypothetical protein
VDAEPNVEGSVVVILNIPQSSEGHTNVAKIFAGVYQVFVFSCCPLLVQALSESPPVRNEA